MIELKKVSVRLGGNLILDKVCFTIKKGSIAAIIGPNGSGKTTLIKAMIGLLPYEGQIKIKGENPKNNLDKIGYVPQRFSFDRTFPLTVGEFMEISQLDPDEKKLVKALSEVGMNHRINVLLGDLSGGQLQRVLIARAIVNNPEVLLLDEPIAGVDIEGEKNFYQIVRHMNRKHGVTVVLISHEVNMVFHYAHQVICINKGLVCQGKPSKVLTKHSLSKLFGSDMGSDFHIH